MFRGFYLPSLHSVSLCVLWRVFLQLGSSSSCCAKEKEMDEKSRKRKRKRRKPLGIVQFFVLFSNTMTWILSKEQYSQPSQKNAWYNIPKSCKIVKKYSKRPEKDTGPSLFCPKNIEKEDGWKNFVCLNHIKKGMVYFKKKVAKL